LSSHLPISDSASSWIDDLTDVGGWFEWFFHLLDFIGEVVGMMFGSMVERLVLLSLHAARVGE
jgi:hypothetical protein